MPANQLDEEQGQGMIVLQLAQIHVPPGQRVVLRQVGWQQFESILAEMGEHRATRLAYRHFGSQCSRSAQIASLLSQTDCLASSQPSSTRAELHECFKHNRGTVLGSLLYLCYAQLQQGTRLKGEG